MTQNRIQTWLATMMVQSMIRLSSLYAEQSSRIQPLLGCSGVVCVYSFEFFRVEVRREDFECACTSAMALPVLLSRQISMLEAGVASCLTAVDALPYHHADSLRHEQLVLLASPADRKICLMCC